MIVLDAWVVVELLTHGAMAHAFGKELAARDDPSSCQVYRTAAVASAKAI